MKVILLAPTPPPAGGIAGWTVRMMNAKLKNNWVVEVVDEKLIGRQVFGNKANRNIFVEIKRCFNIWKNLTVSLRDPDAKVVHSCIPSITTSMMREYVCALITKMKKRKFIIHFRCTVPNTTKGRFGRFFLKKLCDISDLILTLNTQTNEYISNITNSPYVLIPNFISQDELADSHLIRDSIEKVLYVGGVIEEKGAKDIIDVACAFPNIEFRMVGAAASDVQEYARNLKADNVVFVGNTDREGVKKELKDADVFIFMTHFRGEGFSNALAEAMACGLPCIVSDWAANKDMIGSTGGCVVDVGDVSSAIKSLEMMSEREVRERQSLANIQKVSQEYVDSVVLDKYVDAYESLV